MSTMIIVGRLGSDAELRQTTSGTQVAQFSIADKVGYGDKATTQWVKCAMFGDRAAKVHPYLTKGTIVEVVGSPTIEAWLDKEKNPRAAIKINVSEVKLHGGGQKDERPVASKGRATQPDQDDEIPF